MDILRQPDSEPSAEAINQPETSVTPSSVSSGVRKKIELALVGLISAGIGLALAETIGKRLEGMMVIDMGIYTSRHLLIGVMHSEEFFERIRGLLPVWNEQNKFLFPITAWSGLGCGCIADFITRQDWTGVTCTSIAIASAASFATLLEWSSNRTAAGHKIKYDPSRRKNRWKTHRSG